MEKIIIRIADNGQFSKEEFEGFIKRHSNIHLVKEYKNYTPLYGPHYHGWYEGHLSKKSVIGFITKELHCKGNADYSLSQKKLKKYKGFDGYYRYICKGESESIAPKEWFNLSSEFITENHKSFYLHKEEYEKTKGSSGSKLADLTKYVSDNLYLYHEGNVRYIPKYIIQYHMESKSLVSNNQVENYYHYIRSKIDKDYIDIRANSIYNRIENQYRMF